jgi:hypothetical protein
LLKMTEIAPPETTPAEKGQKPVVLDIAGNRKLALSFAPEHHRVPAFPEIRNLLEGNYDVYAIETGQLSTFELVVNYLNGVCDSDDDRNFQVLLNSFDTINPFRVIIEQVKVKHIPLFLPDRLDPASGTFSPPEGEPQSDKLARFNLALGDKSFALRKEHRFQFLRYTGLAINQVKKMSSQEKKIPPRRMGRRDFLKLGGAALGGLCLAQTPFILQEAFGFLGSRYHAYEKWYVDALNLNLGSKPLAQRYIDEYLKEVKRLLPYTLGVRTFSWLLKLRGCPKNEWDTVSTNTETIKMLMHFGLAHIFFKRIPSLSDNQVGDVIRDCITNIGNEDFEAGKSLILDCFPPDTQRRQSLTDTFVAAFDSQKQAWVLRNHPISKLKEIWG